MRWLILVLAVFLLGALPSAVGVLAQPTEDQAYQAFVDAGCTSCHDGGAAPDWEGVKQKIIEWAQNYPTIDDAVANEYGMATTYDEMMEQMRSYTPGITDEQYQILYDYFLALFQQYQNATGGGGETTSPPQTNTTTQPATNTTANQTAPAGGNQTCQATATVTETVTVTETKTVTKIETVTETVYNTVTETVVVTAEQTPPEALETPGTAKYVPWVALLAVLAAAGYILVRK